MKIKTRVCGYCKEEKAISEFYPKQYYCKPCKLFRNKTYRAGKHHGYNLKYLYGITVDEYHALRAKANHSCMICKKEDGVLCLDHCHKTGKVRGILCKRCNASLYILDNFYQETLNYLNDTPYQPP